MAFVDNNAAEPVLTHQGLQIRLKLSFSGRLGRHNDKRRLSLFAGQPLKELDDLLSQLTNHVPLELLSLGVFTLLRYVSFCCQDC